MSEIKKATMLFYDSEASKYGRNASYLHDFERRIIVRAISRTLNEWMLEVGCGWGRYIRYANKSSKIVGIDISENMLIMGEKQFGNSSNVFFVRGDAEGLPLRDDTFDVVYAVRSIKYWPNPRQAVLEAYRVLKSNGRLVFFEISNRCRVEYALLTFLELLRETSRIFVRGITKRESEPVKPSFVVCAFALRSYLRQAGFKHISLEGIYFLPNTFYKSAFFSQISSTRALKVLNWIESFLRTIPSLALLADGILYEARK